ncbi:MAG TPA: AAA family ATPase [Acidimicrobiales bacterium]|nr:AAA family ATPase [Acidimicrobiales bacterium]
MSGPVVVALAGLPGAGKTTLASEIIRRTGWSYISRDEIRESMFQPCRYTDPEKHAAFGAVILAVEATVQLGRSCIVEGMPFSRLGELESVGEAAQAAGAVFVPFLVQVHPAIAAERIRQYNASIGQRRIADRVPGLAHEVAARMRTFGADVHCLEGTGSTRELADTVLQVTESRQTAVDDPMER